MKPVLPLRFGLALVLLSVAVIASQITLMQILSNEQWHHFAFMIISIALLGFGAAGTTISIFRDKLTKHKNTLLPIFAFASGLSLEPGLRLAGTELLSFDLYLLFIDYNHFWKLATNLIIYFLPFYFAALAIGIIFTVYITDISRLYFMNLIGSGLGALLALPVLNLMFPWEAKSLCALLLVSSGLLLLKRITPAYAIIISSGLICAVLINQTIPYTLNISQYKSLSKAMNLPDAKIIYEKPGIFGLNQVITSTAMRYAPGISLSFEGEVPALPAVFINGDFTGIVSKPDMHTNLWPDYSTFALPYAICKPDSVLVLNGGTGYFAVQALRRGANAVVVSEPNKTLVRMMQTNLAEKSGYLYSHENVRVHTIDSRTLLASSKHQYDIIILPVPDAFGGTSGLCAMQENYLLTLEGFNQTWNTLKPNGCLTVSSYLDYPVKTPLKICATLVQMLRENNISKILQHIVMIKSWGTVTFVVTKSPLQEEQINEVRVFCDSLYFDPVLLPGVTDTERNKYNVFSDPFFFSLIDSIVASNMNFDQYGFHIEPSTDNSPYFNHFIRLNTLPLLRTLYNSQTIPYLELGYLIVYVTLIQVTFFAILFILLPLLRLKSKSHRKLPVLIYFSTLGLGYMFVEIIFIQRFIIYFGTPVIAASWVITMMMIASGTGSYISGKRNMTQENLLPVFLIILICFTAILSGLNPLLKATIGLPAIYKTIIAFVVIALPAFFMGMPFPVALKIISESNNNIVPWAWGINGCFSVIASPLAILLAVEAGYACVMLNAILAYCLALIFSGKLQNRIAIP